jgi:hypothetical protein
MSREAGNALRTVSFPVDAVGTTASLACAVHCALTPVVATSLPLLGLGFLADEGTEVALSILSSLLAVVGLGLGFRRHRSHRALLLLPAGILLFVLGRVADGSGWGRACMPCLVGGGLMLAVAHVQNRQLCRTCAACRDIESSESPSPSLPTQHGRRTGSHREASESGALA